MPNFADSGAAAFLAGGGEMGALIRAFDWSQTSLGPLESWSPALRMMVRFLLANRFPLLLWWGPHYVSIYNDAYRPILGKKHPRSIGQPVSECWSEIWHILKPLIDAPFNGGPATWMEDLELEIQRSSFTEETHFTVAYSPVPDETAPRGIGGVLATVHEITEKIIGERRVVALRELGARVAEAKRAEDACAVAAATLGNHAKDIPFALLYLVESAGKRARLASAVGITMGGAASPLVIDLERNPGSVWPLAEVVRARGIVVVEDLSARLPDVPHSPWSEPPRSAVVVPLRSNVAHELSGLLVAGVSARLRLDDLYRGFFELVGAQIATALANARAYEEERRRAEALAEIDRAKTAFFSNVSHEFRTPLTLMLGPLEDALAVPADELPQRRDDLTLIHRNCLRLLRLVNTLLDFSRIEAGRIRASYEPVDLPAFTAELASVFRSATERAGLRLTVDCPPLKEPVWVDREMWEKIVLNLLSNAFKFTFEGGITVRLRQRDGSAVLAVADTGTGIPEREIPYLFDRFHRVEGARGRTHEGTGIGLALVQELASFHGGTADVHSVYGKGSIFAVRIPLGSAHLPQDRMRAERILVSTALGAQPYIAEALRWLPQDNPEQNGESAIEREILPEQPVLASSCPHEARSTILFADDNADMRDYIRHLLSARYEVRTAADGEEALAELRAGRPDLLLSDVMMPHLDGFELLRAVRTDPALAEIPIILLSARAGEEASVEGLEAGADDYLVKPFSARELLARVRANLEMARMRRETAQRIAADLRDMTRLQEVAHRCGSAGNEFEGCLAAILNAAIAITGADKGNIQLLDIETGTLKIAVQRGFEEPFLNFFARVRREEAAACGTAMRSAARVIVEDVRDSEIFAGQPSLDILLKAGVRAVQSTPLVSSAGTVAGMISTHFSRPHRPSERDLRLMDLLAQQAADYLERKKKADAALREWSDILERKVEERTQALETEMAARQKIEAMLQQAQRLEAVGQLTGGVAHDFNNLLQVILANTDMLQTRMRDANGALPLIAAVQRAAERGAQLTSQMLAFARRQQLEPVTLSVKQLILNLDDLVRRAVGEAVTVEISADPELWPSRLDPARFESAMLNLAVNARDAMPEGGHLVIASFNMRIAEVEAIRLDLVPGDYVRISVTDTGTGMAPHVQRRAFEPFFTTKDVGKGTGLGLPQLYGFAKQSGGTATIDSTLGKGTTVALYLPRAETEITEEQSQSGERTAVLGYGRTILIVEDQPDVLDVIGMFLDGLNYRILTAADGVAARKLLESNEPIDLLLTDVVMPNGVSGMDLAQEARRLRQDLRIVMMSGYLRDPHGREGAPPDLVFLEKPFRRTELASAITAAFAAAGQ